MSLDSDAQAVLDQYAKFDAPAIETLSPENARNNPTLKNAVEEMTAESFMARATSIFSSKTDSASWASTVGLPRPLLAVYSFMAAFSSLPMPM